MKTFRTRMTRAVLAAAVALSPSGAQGGYYHLDAGRPSRIEDATPMPRYELELQLALARYEAVASGVRRLRLEPTTKTTPLVRAHLNVACGTCSARFHLLVAARHQRGGAAWLTVHTSAVRPTV